MNPRVRTRERFELSLDGRQVASVVVGALVVLGVVFVLGLNVGRQLAVREIDGARPGDLAALDRAPAPPPAKPEPLTFHDRLTKETPAPPPPEPARPPPPPVPPASPASAELTATQAPPAPPQPVEKGERPAPDAPSVETKPWTVQLAASESRPDAERLASRFASLNPRIEEADVPGKGRFFRVRVGSFETKESAQRYLADVGRETGAKGIVTPAR